MGWYIKKLKNKVLSWKSESDKEYGIEFFWNIYGISHSGVKRAIKGTEIGDAYPYVKIYRFLSISVRLQLPCTLPSCKKATLSLKV